MQYYKLPELALRLIVTNESATLRQLIEAATNQCIDLPDSLSGIDLYNDGAATVRFFMDGNDPEANNGIPLETGKIFKFRNLDPQRFKFISVGDNTDIQIQLGFSSTGE